MRFLIPSFEMEDNRVWIKHFVFLRVAIPAMLSSIRRILGKSGLDACMMMLCGYSINPRSEWVQGIAATSYAFDPARYSDISEAVDEVYTHYAAQGVSEVCTSTLRA